MRAAPDAVSRHVGRTALAVTPPCAVALGHAIEALEDCTVAEEELDALVWRALGWTVERRKAGLHARVWACRGPASATWAPMLRPSRSLEAASLVVPWRWAWSAGAKGGPPHAWVALRWPVQEGVPFFECVGVTPARALLKAALFGQRWQAMSRGAAA